MKRIFTLLMTALAVATFAPMSTAAQEMGELQGYVSVFVRVQASTPGTGRVAVTPPSGGLDTYKETVDFQRTLPVSMGCVYFNIKARPNDGFKFGGWYIDDGDGVFDITKDTFDSDEEKSLIFLPLSYLGFADDFEPYATEAEAKMAQQPTEPQMIIFARYTNGASVYVDYMQEHCGTVEISNPNNQKGDQVTIKAIPNEGYQFEYWKTGRGSQIFATNRDTSVSHDAEWTFTVEGGEIYYAYFSAIDAPVFNLPEEGGWVAAAFNHSWFLHEQADAMIYNPVMGDILTNADGQSFFNQDDEAAWYDNTRHFHNAMRGMGNNATLIYGRGEVRFTNYVPGLGFDRALNILEWSGNKPYTIQDKGNVHGYHVWAFKPELKAFVEIGTTDEYSDAYTESVTVPANTCYICLEGIEIADPVTDFIPTIIGLTPEDYDKAVLGIDETLHTSPFALHSSAVYDLQGRQLSNSQSSNSQISKGLYIQGCKKFFVK